MNVDIEYKRLTGKPQSEKQLTRNYEFDGGLDIYSNTEVIIRAKESEVVTTGIAIDIPQGYVGMVRSRSGLGFKSDIVAFHGTVDSGFTGELKIKLFNMGFHPYKVAVGDKIAQIVIVPCVTGMVREVDKFQIDIDNEAMIANANYASEAYMKSMRGENGFGSSGV